MSSAKSPCDPPMELDPRLQAIGSGHAPSGTMSGSGADNVITSPSDIVFMAAPHHHHHPHHGAETPDTPVSRLGAKGSNETPPSTGSDPKRLRACEACRGLKVRCESGTDEDGPCKRCQRAGRNCVVTMPTRKRQKKTDSRVAELEKKIDALTASLQSKPGAAAALANAVNSPAAASGKRISSEDERGGTPSSSEAWTGVNRAWDSPYSVPPSCVMSASDAQRMKDDMASSSVSHATTPAVGQKRRRAEETEKSNGSLEHPRKEPLPIDAGLFSKIHQGDAVDRGLISIERAGELFARYNDMMVSHLPAVVIPPGTTVAQLREQKPVLFHAIMAVATSEDPALQKILTKELMHIFAEKIIVAGVKTVELIQALQVAVIWYWPPEHFEELKFYQFIHMAAAMAIDIGLGQRLPQHQNTHTQHFRIGPWRRSAPPDPTTIENRRTWLTCYFLAANTSITLRRPNLVRWTPFVAECVEVLQTSPDAAPTDKYFCHLVWTHRLAEEIGMQFALEDSSAMVNIMEPRTQYALKGLERDLEKYSSSIPPELMQPTLRISFGLVSLFMHEVAIQKHVDEPALGPLTDTLCEGLISKEPLSHNHISAISACLTAVDTIIDTFLGMEIARVRCLPVFNFVRVAYTVVILIKVYFSAAAPGSELGQVFNCKSLRVEQRLDAVLDKFRATAADDRSRPAAKFLVVLVMLKGWFHKQSKGDANNGSGDGNGTIKGDSSTESRRSNSEQQQTQYPSHGRSQTANTPLQLLSEVATGTGTNSNNNNDDNNISSSSSSSSNSNNTMNSVINDTTDSNNANAASSHFARSFVSMPNTRQPAQPQPFFNGSAALGASSNSIPTTVLPSSFNSSFPGLTDAMSADLAAAIAPGIPVFPQSGFVPGMDMPPFGPGNNSTLGLGFGGTMDLENMGFGQGSQNAYEDGVRIVMNEPWFNDMFQSMPGSANMFNFSG